MEKEKIVVYPFDVEFCPIARHKSLLENYEITGLVSPHGWGYNGKDGGIADGGNMINMVINIDFINVIKHCDTVVFADFNNKLDMDKDIYPKMREAIQNGKNIISLVKVDDKMQHELIEQSNISGVYFKIFNGTNLRRISGQSGKLVLADKIEVPVIFILGVTEKTGKFELQLAVREKLLNMGYKVSQIGSRAYCEFCGFNSMPEFMFDTAFSEVEKIIMFNNYVKKLEMEDKPDVIIVGIPGGTMKLNNDYTNNFGILAFEISQAIRPDYTIMSTFYEDFKLEYFERLNMSSRYKFGYEIDCFNLASVQFDWVNALELNSNVYLKLSSDFISKKIQSEYSKFDIPILNILNEEHADFMVEDIIEKLGGYGDTEVI